MILSVKLTLQENNPRLLRSEIRPITMYFEIPNHTISNI